MTIARQGLIIIGLLLLVEVFFVITIAILLQDVSAKLARERHVVAVITASSDIAATTQRLGTVLAQQAAPRKLREMLGNSKDVDRLKGVLAEQFRSLRALAGKDEDALRMLREQEHIVEEAVRLHERDVEFYRDRDSKEKQGYAATMLATAHDISGEYTKFLARYKKVGESAPQEISDSISRLKQMMLIAVALNVVGGLWLAYVFSRRVSGRLVSLADNMKRYQNQEPLHSSAQISSDEIGQLESLFQKMVENLDEGRRNETALVEGAYDVICTIDQDGLFTAVNAACKRQWDYDVEELVGEHFERIVSGSGIAKIKQQLEGLRSRRGFVSFDAKVKRRDGGLIDTSWSCYWSDDNLSAFCFVRDVSELNSMEATLRQREEQVRTLMRNIPVGVLVVDGNGVVKSANNKVETLIDSNRGALLEQPVGMVLIAEDGSSEPLKLECREAVKRCRLKRFEGEPIAVEITVTALNEVDRLVVVEDVRERVRFEKAKRDFVILLRENLRTPLARVRSIVGTAGGATDEISRNRLARIISNIDRLLGLLDELLTIETISPGKLVGELKPVNLGDIVQAATESLNDYALKQGVSIATDIDTALKVNADRERLIQVLVNLLSNAVKFSPSKSEVLVRSSVLGELVELSVSDKGKGVPAHMQTDIFKPYVQANENDARKGTGLGLPICKSIVESHRGEIGVSSTVDGGSTFWFRIPRSS